MRRLLIIAHDFPPSAGGGVQRIAKISQYLPDHGWQPTVLCAGPVSGRPTDATLLDDVSHVDVVRLPARDISTAVASVYRPLKSLRSRMSGKRGGERAADAGAAASRGAMGMPMSTRIVRRWFLDSAALWGRQVASEAHRLHRAAPFDAVLASGPPPSALIAGVHAAELCGVPLIADFRDSWMSNPDLRWPENPRRDAASLEAEHSVVRRAELAIAVSDPIADEIRGLGMDHVMVVPNGFDPADLPLHAPSPGPLRVGFMGRFYGAMDPTPFFDGVMRAVRDWPECREMTVDIVGPPSQAVVDMVGSRGLQDVVTFRGFLAHSEALAVMAGCDVGLVSIADLPGAEANYTGKLFEYLGVGLPVLLVGPADGVAASLIRDARAGRVAPYGDSEAVASALAEFAAAKRSGITPSAPIDSVIAPFDRREQVASLAAAFDALLSGSERA